MGRGRERGRKERGGRTGERAGRIREDGVTVTDRPSLSFRWCGRPSLSEEARRKEKSQEGESRTGGREGKGGKECSTIGLPTDSQSTLLKNNTTAEKTISVNNVY